VKLAMSLLLWTMTLSFILLMAGLIGCATTRCSTGFDLGTVFAVVRWFASKPEQISREAQREPDPNPTPYQDLARETLSQWQGWGQQQIDRASNQQTDFRLVQCPSGSVTNLPEVSYTKAQEALNKQFSSLEDLTAFLGTPHCKIESSNHARMRWLVAGGRILDADLDGVALTLTPTNF